MTKTNEITNQIFKKNRLFLISKIKKSQHEFACRNLPNKKNCNFENCI